MKDELARIIGELMYLRDNEKDYFVIKAYENKLKAIDELLKLAPNEVNVLDIVSESFTDKDIDDLATREILYNIDKRQWWKEGAKFMIDLIHSR